MILGVSMSTFTLPYWLLILNIFIGIMQALQTLSFTQPLRRRSPIPHSSFRGLL
jgi:hypothetical protein